MNDGSCSKKPPAGIAEATALLLAAALIAGCSSPLNRGRTIGGTVAMQSVTPEVERPPRQWPSPSITSLDRSNWAETRFVVPLDAVEHQPLYAQHAPQLHQMARQRGEYPTAETALDVPTTDMLDEQAAEIGFETLAAAVDIALFPVRAFLIDPWQTVASPLEPYARAPGAQPAAPDAAAVEAAPGQPGALPAEGAEPVRRRPRLEVGE